MARPIKDNADYFTHDKDMRNDARIKALRRKFPLVGYYTWNMLLEVLTDASDFTIKYNDLQIELLSGDFEVEPDQLKSIIEYLLKLELLVLLDDIIFCPKQIERFSPLIDKRNRQRTVFQTAKTANNVVSDSESTQSKVKYSKVDKSKVKKENIFTPPIIDDVKKYFDEKGYCEKAAVKAFEYYHTANWHDSHGRKVKNWKQKMISVWFKEEYLKEKSSGKKEKSTEDLTPEELEKKYAVTE